MTITSTSTTEIVLLLGSVVAILVGLFGVRNKRGTQFGTAIQALSGIVGIFLILWAILMVMDGTWALLMLLMVLVLGIGLLFPLLPNINIGTILALIVALIAGFAVSSLGGWAILIVFLVAFIILWLVLRLVFGAVKLMAMTLASRWVLLGLGIIGIIVVVISVA